MATAISDDRFLTHSGPIKGVTYPLRIIYCPVCDNWPVEYAEHHPNYEQAKEWMESNLSDEMLALHLKEDDQDQDEAGDGKKKSKRQTRGGKGVVRTKKKTQEPQQICLSRAPRGKRKFVTVITGLATYDIGLKEASKFFANKFSCGASVTGDDEIVIQGDVKDDLFEMIPEKWRHVDEDNIEDLGDMKR